MPAHSRVSHSGPDTSLLQELGGVCLYLNEQDPCLHLSLNVAQSPVHCSTTVQGVQYSSVAGAGETLLVAAESQVWLVLGKGGRKNFLKLTVPLQGLVDSYQISVAPCSQQPCDGCGVWREGMVLEEGVEGREGLPIAPSCIQFPGCTESGEDQSQTIQLVMTNNVTFTVLPLKRWYKRGLHWRALHGVQRGLHTCHHVKHTGAFPNLHTTRPQYHSSSYSGLCNCTSIVSGNVC